MLTGLGQVSVDSYYSVVLNLKCSVLYCYPSQQIICSELEAQVNVADNAVFEADMSEADMSLH